MYIFFVDLLLIAMHDGSVLLTSVEFCRCCKMVECKKPTTTNLQTRLRLCLSQTNDHQQDAKCFT